MDWHCNTIICVDDEESILDSYRDILAPEENDDISEILAFSRSLGETDEALDDEEKIEYNVIYAASGEEALTKVEEELAAGRRVAAGFFDMRMPGGMDGYQTIEKIRALDGNILCAVVTAYTDRNVIQIRKLFTKEHQDELLYFKKPFAPEELEQTALNMVNSWNRKRKIEDHIRSIEKHKKGLGQILHAVSCLTSVPPHSLQHLGPGILFQLLGIVDGDNGYAIFLGNKTELNFSYGIGRYESGKDIIEEMNSSLKLETAFSENHILFDETYCFVPLVAGDVRLGGLYIETESKITNYLALELLEVFKNQMAQLVLNSLYHVEIVVKDQEIVTDPLTGLYNRRFLTRRFREEINRAKRFQHNISVLMVDIDDFKHINDKYGHDAGDQVLINVGNILRLTVRNYDLIGQEVKKIGEIGQFAVRFGGEEFCIVLLEASDEATLLIGERIRKKVEEYDFRINGESVRLTVSVGAYSGKVPVNSKEDDFLKELTLNADSAMYRAKKEGKNKVVLYTEGM